MHFLNIYLFEFIGIHEDYLFYIKNLIFYFININKNKHIGLCKKK